jgi:hypothetical protein
MTTTTMIGESDGPAATETFVTASFLRYFLRVMVMLRGAKTLSAFGGGVGEGAFHRWSGQGVFSCCF